MSDSATEQTAASRARVIHVEAQADHLNSLARAKPINALAELIWNALDADADAVQINVEDNDLDTPARIEVVDNGLGIPISEAERAFGNLGGSWKRDRRTTPNTNKKMHGRDGKGRFKAFALGSEVTWQTVYHDATAGQQQFSIRGKSGDLQKFDIAPVEPAPNHMRGTRVKISGIQERLGVFAADGSGGRQLAEVFALYLRNYPAVKITFRGERVDPKSVQKSLETLALPGFEAMDGTPVSAQLDVIEWSFTKKERRLCLCDAEGFTLHEVEAGVRPGTEYNFTAYIRCDFIARLHEQNALALDELNPEIHRLIDSARTALRGYFRRRKAETAAELVKQWKAEGVYPFADGEASDALEKARREVFDICALNVHEYLDSFRSGVSRDRRFTLRMLRTALDENPEALKRILSEVLDLPKERQNELADLLQFTTLSAIIEASKMVSERLQFLTGLEELLFSERTKKSLKERTQLHRMLESETWIFGEEYLLTNSDENLNTVLKKHLATLRPGERRRRLEDPVRRDDGSQAVIDMLLGREIPAYAQPKREYLVVEFKRPSEKIDLKVKAQIESYAMAVAKDERFDKNQTAWTFLAVSNEMTEEASLTLRQTGKAVGYFHDTPNLKIGLATWSEVIRSSRTRLDAFRTKLAYTATRDEGVALLHEKYRKYLPSNMRPASAA